MSACPPKHTARYAWTDNELLGNSIFFCFGVEGEKDVIVFMIILDELLAPEEKRLDLYEDSSPVLLSKTHPCSFTTFDFVEEDFINPGSDRVDDDS